MDSILVDKPKLGFIGVGWIGMSRMEAVVQSKLADVSCVQDMDSELSIQAKNVAPGAQILDPSDDINLMNGVDGVIIATPSAMHADQSIKALNAGKAVFCQKPLGRNLEETLAVVTAAKENDKLLGVDLSYRYTNAMQAIKKVIESGELGEIYAVDLVFHNAYGPDKKWYFDPQLSGGGCVIDLGVHLVDLALWLLNYPTLTSAQSSLFSKGRLLENTENEVEDYANAHLVFNDRISVQLACSWNLHAGCDAVIKADFYGTKGGASFHNINGSFYDFVAERFQGTSKETISSGKDNWSGKAAVAWVETLCSDNKYNDDARHFVDVAKVLDAIYKRI